MIYVGSTKSSQTDNIFKAQLCCIYKVPHKSKNQHQERRLMLIPLHQVNNIFNPPCAISTSDMTNQHQGRWFVSICLNQVKSTTSSTHHQSPFTIFSKSWANWLPWTWQIDIKRCNSCVFNQFKLNQHFQPTFFYIRSPDAPHFLNPVQIDFWYDESTSRETICVY